MIFSQVLNYGVAESKYVFLEERRIHAAPPKKHTLS